MDFQNERTLDENRLEKFNTDTVIYNTPLFVHQKINNLSAQGIKGGCISQGFHNREWIGTFHPKQLGCDKQLVVITKYVLTKFYCSAFIKSHAL